MSTQEQFELEVEVEENGFYKVNDKPENKFVNSKFKSEWQKYGNRLVITIGIVLIAAISFEAGYMKGKSTNRSDIVINKIEQSAGDLARETAEKSTAVSTNSTTASAQNITATDTKNCPYVASKNSNKYHLATCQFAAKIKPENKVCFSSAEEAKNRGYLGAKCCIK